MGIRAGWKSSAAWRRGGANLGCMSVQHAFDTARAAQRTWATTPLRQRSSIFLRYHGLILAHRDELVDLIQQETGKAKHNAFDEVMDVAITARHYAYRAKTLLAPARVRGAMPLVTRTEVHRASKGVVGVIAPWNYPLSLAVSDAVAALIAGNAVVLKPDSQTPRTAQRAHQLLVQAGLPADLFQVVEGSGKTVGQEIVKRCDFLMFTGSTATGRTLAAQAGERLIGFSAELGGKNPLLVLASADPEVAARGAVDACFSNTGQLCISVERVYVDRAVADEFLARFVALTKGLRIGHGWGDDVGSLISAEHRARVDAFVHDAVDKGATVLAGGEALPRLGDTFYAPTILVDVPEDADLYREEVFGPVVFVEVVDGPEVGVEKMNDTDYGLNASIWGAEDEARVVAGHVHAGTVNINEGYAAAWASMDAPMGGWKQSGVGRRHGDEGLLKYTEARTVAAQRHVSLGGVGAGGGKRVADAMALALRLGKRLLR